jgi:[acyl-carrier-protein] S-malonyltransferase
MSTMPQGKMAYVFPGQGSQKVGMGRDLYDNFAPARAVFDRADRVLGFQLSKLCFEGPEETLRQTINAQPALVTMSFACLQAARSVVDTASLPRPFFLAGHSLGEYSALAVAGVLDFDEVVSLARQRGRLMQEAGDKTPGTMAAILGLDEAAVAAICQDTGTWVANVNCPGQLVISGAKANVDQAVSLAQARGAAKAILLQVSGAFHSPLMQSAVDGIGPAINQLSFKEAEIPVVANTSAQPLSAPKDIKAELLAQLCHTVQWQRTVEYMLENGVTTVIEIGAGKVLTGLNKRINKDIRLLNVGEQADLVNIAG